MLLVSIIFLALVPILLILGWLLIYFLTPLKRYHISQQDAEVSERLEDIPTVSLCIPARNETHALEDCLGAAIASDYPKLEIIVLDDCSQDRTSQIIRSFAHDGVRFVQGEVPSDGWLGKNNAYDILVREARGEYLIFMSVDTRIDRQVISQMIAYMQLKKLSMISVLPERRDFWRASVLFAPMRYFWQMILPLSINTPFATSLWAVSAKQLERLGGFASYKNNIMVENILATKTMQENSYRFLVANTYLRSWYEKKWSSQIETGIRLWYPSLGQHFLGVVAASIAHLYIFILPVCIAVFLLMQDTLHIILLVMAISAVVFGNLLYALYFRETHTHGLLGGVITFTLFPFLVLQEIIILWVSYYRYKRGRVDWKGRNVCYPMQPEFHSKDA